MVQIAKLLSNSKYNFWIFCFLLISMTSAMMYFYSPLCPGIDFHVHYNRFLILMEALNEGNFPVYMDYYVIDGYGYILKLFYSDFLLIPFAWIGNLTNDVLAYNIMIFTVTLICGISTYKASKAITKSNFAAILTAILYTFCAYRMGNIYMRGALGESLALSFLPVILWGGYEIIFGDKKKWYILAIGFSLLIFSHVISSVISLITLFIFLIIGYKYFIREPKRIVYLLVAGIVTLLLTAYYTLPMLEQMLSNSFYYQTHKLIPFMVTSKITDLTAGLFNIILEGSSSNFMVTGAILTVGVLTRLFVTTKTKILKYIDITVGVAVVYLVIGLRFFPWDTFPFSLLKFIQCTWRFFGQVSIIFALAGGYYMSLIAVQKNKRIAILFTLVIIQLFVFNSDSFFYKTQICKDKTHDLSINTTFFGIIGAEYLPSKLPKNTSGYPIKGVFNDFIHNRGQVVKYADDSTKISNFNKNKGHITFDAEVKNNDNLELPLTYYIGYRATLDGKQVEYQQSEFGLIEVPINKSGKVEVEYVGTTLQQISLYITLISIIVLLLYIAKLKYGRKNI